MSDSTKTRRQRVSSIVESALAREPSERAALIESECAGDSKLRHEVEDLIAAHEAPSGNRAQTVLSEPPSNLLTLHEVESLIGKRIGSYKVISELGRGGMGTVCLAVRDDDHYQKRVAIKVVKRGMDTDEIVRRFRYERQILASLDHPNISRILDGGTTDDGLPYFVMEYVEGLSITNYCDAHKLSTTERLGLFRTVCLAVSFAHQNLVVHRDLKPSNIIVTEAGHPELLDFGIAKVLKPDLFPQTVIPTGLISRPMTPDYASPEQVRGLPITTASDIYSLGVLLYELLTGHRPYRLKSYAQHEIERVICEEEPERPSTVVNRTEIISPSESSERISVSPESVSKTRDGQPDKLRRRLAGDLDNILLMALRKEPKRRYASVEQFSEDIRHHLEGLPVLAHKDTLLYRSRKFVWRHKVSLGIAAAIMLLIVAFSVVTVVQSARVKRERDRAEKVSAFLVELFKVADPNRTHGDTVTAREILDNGAAKIEQELKDEPEVQAKLQDTIGQVYQNLGLYDKAELMLAKALETRRRINGNESKEVIESLSHLAEVQQFRSDLTGAETSLREAVDLGRKLYGENSSEIALTLHQLAALAFARGDLAAADSTWREVLTIRRNIYGDNHTAVAKVLNNLGINSHQRGDLSAAENYYREALAIQRRVAGSDDSDSASMLDNFATLNVAQGRFDEAERTHREALAIRRKVDGDISNAVVQTLHNLAILFEKTRDFEKAENFHSETLLVTRKLYGEEHPNVALALHNLGDFLFLYKEDRSAAEPILRQALLMRRKLLGQEHMDIGATEIALAWLLIERGELQEAESLLKSSLQTWQRLAPNDATNIAVIKTLTGELMMLQGKTGEAEPLLRASADVLQKSVMGNRWIAQYAKFELGVCLLALKRYSEAEPLLKESVVLLAATFKEKSPRVERARKTLGKLYEVTNQQNKAAVSRR